MHSTHLKKLAIGTMVVLSFTVLATPIGYLSRLLMARALSIEDYGLFYAAIAVFWFFITFNDLGFGYSILYFVPKWVKEKKFSEIWKAFIYEFFLEIGTTIAIGIGLFFAADWLAVHYFGSPLGGLMIKILMIYLLGNSFLSSFKRIFTGLQQEYYYASVEFFRVSIISILSAVALSYGEHRLWVYATIWAGAHMFLATIYGVLFYLKNNHLFRKLSWDRALFGQMLTYALPTLLIQSVAVFSNYADTIILTIISGTTSVGIYNVYYPIASIPLFILTPVTSLLLPFYSYHVEDGVKRLKKLTEFFIQVLFFFGLYFGIFISFYSTQSINLLFGEKWLTESSLGLEILSIGFVFQLLTIFYITVVNSLGMLKTRLKISIIIAVLTIVLGVIFTLLYGLIGLIWSNVIVYLMSSILFGIVVHKHLSIGLPSKFIFISVISICSFAIFTKLIFPSPDTKLSFFAAGIFYSIVVMGTGYLIFKSELNAIIFELRKAKMERKDETIAIS